MLKKEFKKYNGLPHVINVLKESVQTITMTEWVNVTNDWKIYI